MLGRLRRAAAPVSRRQLHTLFNRWVSSPVQSSRLLLSTVSCHASTQKLWSISNRGISSPSRFFSSPPSSSSSSSPSHSSSDGESDFSDGESEHSDEDGSDHEHSDEHDQDHGDALVQGHVPKFNQVTAIPIATRPLFPNIPLPMVIKDPELAASLFADDAKLHEKYVGVFLRDEGDEEHGIHRTGMYAQIRQSMTGDEDSTEVLLYGVHRVKITGVVSENPLRVSIAHVDEDTGKYIDYAQAVVEEETHESQPIDEVKEKLRRQKDEDAVRAYTLEMMATIKDILSLSPLFKEQLQYFVRNANLNNPSLLADHAAWITSANNEKLQEILETPELLPRLHKALLLLKKEKDISELQQHIHKNVEEKLGEQQRKALLQEQLKAIKRELGLEKDDKDALVQKFRGRLEDKVLDEQVTTVIDEEMDKFQSLETNSMEFNITRNYLDWLTIMPWSKQTADSFDIDNAEKVLAEDHYGMKDVKERILEFIAVGSLLQQEEVRVEAEAEAARLAKEERAAAAAAAREASTDAGTEAVDAQVDHEAEAVSEEEDKPAYPESAAKDSKVDSGAKIICLVGPPGVGKTSIGKSIARALNREFYRFSVGGMYDVAEIKGHRRTYVGAMPGKLVQCMKKVQCVNPVILIDEIDKMGRGSNHGDPSSALLEVLDPEQNSSFMDHYMDVPVDLSKVLFICTANVADTIPGPLQDRMDFIRLSGYVEHEKVEILKRYLQPVAEKKTGVAFQQKVTLTDEAAQSLIRWYCREAGVRNLQKTLEKIYRKIALQLARGSPTETPTEELVVTADTLHEYIGQPTFTSHRLYEHAPVGVVMGLAWNAMGGATLYIESSISEWSRASIRRRDEAEQQDADEDSADGGERGGDVSGLFCTGQMGDVMKESTMIAYTVAKAHFHSLRPNDGFFRQHRIHMHVPEGATPKDGPSAGITMVTSILSLALNRPTRDIAMTGEVTLTGKVLPIGGVREKTIAARRSMVNEILLPIANKKDWDELDEDIRQDMRVHFVDHYDDVFKHAFGEEQ